MPGDTGEYQKQVIGSFMGFTTFVCLFLVMGPVAWANIVGWIGLTNLALTGGYILYAGLKKFENKPLIGCCLDVVMALAIYGALIFQGNN